LPDMFCKDQFVTVQFKYWNEKGSRKSKDNLNKYGLIVFKTTTPQPFYGPFSRTTQVSQCPKKASSGLYGPREDNKRQTPTIRVGATPSGLISSPPPSIPQVLRRMPFLPQPSQFILAWNRHRNVLDCIPPRFGI